MSSVVINKGLVTPGNYTIISLGGGGQLYTFYNEKGPLCDRAQS